MKNEIEMERLMAPQLVGSDILLLIQDNTVTNCFS
jgi:hypothetical protein